MTNVVFIDQHGKMRPLDYFFILARNIKFIHIPKEVNASFQFKIYLEMFSLKKKIVYYSDKMN